MELVSVIVPVFQAERYIDICVNSILSQTYRNIEVILVDDGSTDQSVSKCDEYCIIDSRVTVIHKKNGGVASARNTGLLKSSGEYIMFVDSDDWIEESMIEELLEIARREEADIVECGFVQCKDGRSNRTPYNDKLYILKNKEEIFLHSFVHGVPYLYKVCWGKLIRKELCDGILFPSRTVAEDSAFCDQLLFRCKKVIKSYNQYYNYRITPGSIMHSEIKPSVFQTMDTVIEMTEMLRKDDFNYSAAFWKALDQHISNCATGIADQIISKGYKLADIEGFDLFYKKCKEIEKDLYSPSCDFHMFVQDYHKWGRFRCCKNLKRRIFSKVTGHFRKRRLQCRGEDSLR